jgi:hypothetical protein
LGSSERHGFGSENQGFLIFFRLLVHIGKLYTGLDAVRVNLNGR